MNPSPKKKKWNSMTPAKMIAGGIFLVLFVLVLSFQACSGSGTSASSPDGSTTSSTLTVIPSLITVIPGGSTYFSATGGTSPYTYSVPLGGGSINQSGYFTAPAATGVSTIQVTDSAGATAMAYVTISSSGSNGTLSLSPLNTSVIVGSTVAYSTSGGSGSYSYTTTGGSFTGNVFNAPATVGSYSIYVSDGAGHSASTNVYVISSSNNNTVTSALSVSASAIAGIQSGCTTAAPTSDACMSASHRFCVSQGYTSGFGPVEYNTDSFLVVCMPSSKINMAAVAFGTLSTYAPGCSASDPTSGLCFSGVNRYCVASGHTGGFGPVEHDIGTAIVGCLKASANASILNTTYSTLGGYTSECNVGTPRSGACNSAIHRYCVASGYVSGYGPVDHAGDAANVVCVR